MAGETNTHFVHRFGAAILLSVISAGLQALANEATSNSVNAVIISSPQQASNVATVALQKDIDIPPTITVPQGRAIRVRFPRPRFLGRDPGAMNDGVYLRRYLAPFDEWLLRPDVTDILVNRPGEVWVETVDGETSRFDAPQLTETDLARLARQVAGAASQGVNREQPLLSASLPDGARQIIAPPATRAGLVLAIRKHAI